MYISLNYVYRISRANTFMEFMDHLLKEEVHMKSVHLLAVFNFLRRPLPVTALPQQNILM